MKICQECLIIRLRVKSTNTGQILIVKKLILHDCLVLGGRTPHCLMLHTHFILSTVYDQFYLTFAWLTGWGGFFSVNAVLWTDDINSNSTSGLILLIKTVKLSWFQLQLQLLETIENQAIIHMDFLCFSERIKQVKGVGSGTNCSSKKL